MKESDLYPHLKAWLEGNGYAVRAEVGGCDVAALKDGNLALIEMKLSINLDLVLQALKRQRADAAVYVAVPAPSSVTRRWLELERLLKRLEIGLILVYMQSVPPRVELAFHPVRQERQKNRAATRAMLKEMAGRSLDLNVGGSNRQKRVTAYREEALAVAAALERLGPSPPRALRALGTSAKTGAILLADHYGWFERLGKGLYGLTEQGKKGLEEYAELADRIRAGLG